MVASTKKFNEKAVRYNSLYRKFSKGRQAAYEERERESELYYATIKNLGMLHSLFLIQLQNTQT